MSIENELRDYILDKYHSINDFAHRHDIPTSTLYSMFKRGVGSSSVTVVLKVCKALGISADALANDRIELNNSHTKENSIDIYEPLKYLKKYIGEGGKFTIKGDPLTENEIDSLFESIEVLVEITKKKHQQKP